MTYLTFYFITFPLLFSIVQKQFRVANIDPEQLTIHLIHGARLFQAQGGGH